jgi:hypothetical protein
MSRDTRHARLRCGSWEFIGPGRYPKMRSRPDDIGIGEYRLLATGHQNFTETFVKPSFDNNLSRLKVW